MLLGLFLFVPSCNFSNVVLVNEVATPAQDYTTLLIDYSHGQLGANPTVEIDDLLLASELEDMGYEVIWATGGINSSILVGIDGLLLASIYNITNIYSVAEIAAIQDWFADGHRFLWVGCDSDYTSSNLSGQFINDNMALVLEAVGSHVYPEPTAVEDPTSNGGAAYRVIANQVSAAPIVSDVVEGVDTVLMHGPTLMYGSDNVDTPGVAINPVPLESNVLPNVYPLLFYSDSAIVVDGDSISPITHTNGQTGAFVAATMEFYAGESENCILVTSGASPYASYRSMHTSEYYVNMTGNTFVLQTIDFSMTHLTISATDTSTTSTTTTASNTTTPTIPLLESLPLIISMTSLVVIVTVVILIIHSKRTG
jgi:hypothetical protein